MHVAFLVCVGSVLTSAARADDGIPPKVLADLKAGTVFVRVQTERGKSSGSGFVVAAGGGSALIVTNRHVVAPKERGAVTGIQAVFHSGKPGSEQVLDAKILVTDTDQDLAVLEVSGAKDVPKPLDVTTAVEAYETMPVYSFGFPFGEALSATKGNPALTVGKATVSSLRQDDKGEVAAIQLDGNLNPGNSGGPIVDGKGRVIGVAVAGVRGAGIGLAIPRAEVTRLLARQGARLSVQPGVPKNGKVDVDLSLLVLDPSQKVTAVWVRVVRAADVPKGQPIGGALTGGEVAQLKVDGFRARGTLTLKADKPDTVPYLFQVIGPDGSKPGERVAADVSFDPSAFGVAGQWTRVTEGLTELWSIRRTGGKWEVSGVFLENEKEVGSFTSSDAEVTGKTITFVQKYVKPPRGWPSGASITAVRDGDKLVYAWRLHGSSDTREMRRPRLSIQPGAAKGGKVEVDLSLLTLDPSQKATVRVRAVRTADAKGQTGTLTGGEVVELKPDGVRARGTVTLTADKPDTVPYLFQVIDSDGGASEPISADVCFDPSASAVTGQWTRVTEGITELWSIRRVDGKWEATGVFLEDSKEVGAFVGASVEVAGRTVTFVQKFTKQPPRVWLSGATITAVHDGDKLVYTWKLHGSSGTRDLTRPQLTVQPGLVKDGKVDVDLSLLLLDPSQKVTAVRVRVVRAADVPKGQPIGGALTGGEVAQLKVDGFRARGTLTLKADKPDTVPYLFQVIGPDAVASTATVAAEVCFDPKASGVAGQWTRVTEGLTELWSIRLTDGKWEVSGVYLEDGKEVGSFVGSDVKVTGKTIEFVHKFVKNPPRAWLSGTAHTAELNGDKLVYTWRFGGSSGTREMARPKR